MVLERLSMYDDLMENDPEMKRLRAKYAAEGRAEGLAEGKAKGLAEGKAEALRLTILTFVKTRFPALTLKAQKRVERIKNADKLQNLFEQLISAPDDAAASAILTKRVR